MNEMRNVYNIFVGQPKGKRPLRRHRLYGRITLVWILGKQDSNM